MNMFLVTGNVQIDLRARDIEAHAETSYAFINKWAGHRWGRPDPKGLLPVPTFTATLLPGVP